MANAHSPHLGQADGRAVTITSSAAKRVAYLITQEKVGAQIFLRLSVSGGGCSGFQYHFGFDHNVSAEDRVFERDGIRLVVDDTSLDLLDGAEVDFVEDLIGASFQVRNPIAVSSCGCGTSFAI